MIVVPIQVPIDGPTGCDSVQLDAARCKSQLRVIAEKPNSFDELDACPEWDPKSDALSS